MTCRDIDNLMSSASANPNRTPEAVEHLVNCADCRTLVRVLWEGEKIAAVPDTQKKRIQARIAENLKPVRPLAPSRFFLFACAIIFLSIMVIGVTPFGMNGWGALSTAQRFTVFAMIGVSAVLLAISMVGQMVPGSKYTFAPTTLPVGVLAILMVVFAVTFRSKEESTFLADGLACVRSGLTYSIPAMFLFWLLVRRGAILSPKLMGAAAGGLAGLIGLSVLEINCSNLNLFHIMVWHWGVVLISSVAGVLFGTAVEYGERWRRQKAS